MLWGGKDARGEARTSWDGHGFLRRGRDSLGRQGFLKAGKDSLCGGRDFLGEAGVAEGAQECLNGGKDCLGESRIPEGMRGFLGAGKNSLGDARIPQGWQELPGDFLEETRIHREGLPSGPKLPEGRGELPKGSQRCPREAGIHWERQGFLGRSMNALGEPGVAQERQRSPMGRQGFLRKSTASLGETPLLAGRGPKGL